MVYINRTNKSDPKKKKTVEGVQNECRTSVSVCWRKLQTTCRFHPRFHVSRQTHCSIAGPGELWGTCEINKGIRMLCKRQQNNLLSVMCFILFLCIISKFLLGIVYDMWNLWFFKTESWERRLLGAMPCSKRSGRQWGWDSNGQIKLQIKLQKILVKLDLKEILGRTALYRTVHLSDNKTENEMKMNNLFCFMWHWAIFNEINTPLHLCFIYLWFPQMQWH